jgi:hypothetical protein
MYYHQGGSNQLTLGEGRDDGRRMSQGKEERWKKKKEKWRWMDGRKWEENLIRWLSKCHFLEVI